MFAALLNLGLSISPDPDRLIVEVEERTFVPVLTLGGDEIKLSYLFLVDFEDLSLLFLIIASVTKLNHKNCPNKNKR